MLARELEEERVMSSQCMLEGPGDETEKGELMLDLAGRHTPGILGAASSSRQTCTRWTHLYGRSSIHSAPG